MLKLSEKEKAEIRDFGFGDEQEDGWGGMPHHADEGTIKHLNERLIVALENSCSRDEVIITMSLHLKNIGAETDAYINLNSIVNRFATSLPEK